MLWPAMTERACLIPGVELRTPLTLGFHASDFPAAYDMIEVFSILAASPMTGAMLRYRARPVPQADGPRARQGRCRAAERVQDRGHRPCCDQRESRRLRYEAMTESVGAPCRSIS
jgi:hypothetical protein